MGCDIHLHVEVKTRGTESWQHYQHLSVNRDYKLFTIMAGVRGRQEQEKAIALPRGLPADSTPITQLDYQNWNGDAHSASWLSALEISEISDRIRKEPLHENWDETEAFGGYLFGNYYSDFMRNPEDFEGLVDLRFVFWFDN